MKIPFYKRVLSYIFPISLRRSHSGFNPNLEILLYQGRLQLAAKDALYSDGDKYLPAVTVVNQLKTVLPAVQQVLVLGCGLGSIVEIMRQKGHTPAYTLVEQDEVVLQWAMELLGESHGSRITPICADAQAFMRQHSASYDLIFIDIFDDLMVPPFVYDRDFLQQCRDCLAPGGYVAFNYIAANERENEQVQRVFAEVFPNHWIAKTDRNVVFFGGGLSPALSEGEGGGL